MSEAVSSDTIDREIAAVERMIYVDQRINELEALRADLRTELIALLGVGAHVVNGAQVTIRAVARFSAPLALTALSPASLAAISRPVPDAKLARELLSAADLAACLQAPAISVTLKP